MITLQNYSFFLKKQKITSSFTNIYANFAVRITNKINLFRDYICKEPPANWEQFFKELENRCKPMKAPQKKYTLLQIPAGNKELQRIILTDPTIRKYTLKAEGFILLVESNNKGKVVEALKKYGYLL